MEVAVEAGEGNDADAGRAHQVVDESFIWRNTIRGLLFHEFSHLGVFDFESLLVV